jgi:16S rRNA (cytidine1402-2'-O)-methyltransferase
VKLADALGDPSRHDLGVGTLYLVATPIGNLEDITLRALRVLGEVALVAAEDTRTARKLMTHHGVSSRMLSYNEHNMAARTPQILKVLGDEQDVALVSEAGTPGISDPGYELILAAIEAGHRISPIPGPVAPVAAVVASGLPPHEFVFLGFLPRRSVERRRLLESVKEYPRTLVVFESPHRVLAALEDLMATLGDRRVAVCREMTKVHEEIFRGTVSEAIARFESPRGEFTLVIEGATDAPEETTDEAIIGLLRPVLAAGASKRDAATRVAQEVGAPRRRVYQLALGIDPTD